MTQTPGRSGEVVTMSSLTDLFGHLNESMREMGADVEIGAEVSLPVQLTYGPIEMDTHLEVRVTEGGWDLVDPEAQVSRIRQEMVASFGEGGQLP